MVAAKLLPIALVLSLLLAACAPGDPTQRVHDLVAARDLRGARIALERERDLHPHSADAHIALGQVYYLIAREDLDRLRDESGYLFYLERSVDEFLTALEIDPKNHWPHFYLAMMDVYRGDLAKAMRGFRNTRRLDPSGFACTNIAEMYIYMGQRHKARYWDEVGLREGAPAWVKTFNEMLLSWKEGDLDLARRHFATLKNTYPDGLRTINMARLPSVPTNFEEFAGYCCRSPACGPYMRNACQSLSLEVHDQKLSKEAVLKELRIEMEKQRRLNEIYRQHKELHIELETPAPSSP